MRSYPVLDPVSQAYPRAKGRSPTCYSPVRRSCTPKGLTARLACVKHAASVRPEPGSNSPSNAYRQKTTPTPTGVRADAALITSKQTTQTNMALTKQHTVEFSKNKHTPSRTHISVDRSRATCSEYIPTRVMSTHADRTLPSPSRGPTTRGFSAPTRHGKLPASPWLPFGAAEATDQPWWMSNSRADPHQCHPCGQHHGLSMSAIPLAFGETRAALGAY
jgi:hypothetical protein